MSGRLRLAATVVGLLGIAVSGYLTAVHYAGVPLACGISHGCARVQASPYAELAGIPVALLGVLGYAAIVAAVWLPGEAALLTAAGLALGGFGFSLYLTYRELFDIGAVCQWCVASQALMAALAALTVARALLSPAPATLRRP